MKVIAHSDIITPPHTRTSSNHPLSSNKGGRKSKIWQNLYFSHPLATFLDRTASFNISVIGCVPNVDCPQIAVRLVSPTFRRCLCERKGKNALLYGGLIVFIIRLLLIMSSEIERYSRLAKAIKQRIGTHHDKYRFNHRL